MKTCPKCKAQFPDTQMFCSNCGSALSSDSAPSGVGGFFAAMDAYYGRKDVYRNEFERLFKAHSGMLFGILSLLVYFLAADDVVIGATLAIAGLLTSKYEDTPVQQAIAMACSIVTLILTVLLFL